MVIQFYAERFTETQVSTSNNAFGIFNTLEPWSILRIQPIQVTKQWLHYVSSLDSKGVDLDDSVSSGYKKIFLLMCIA